MNRPAPGPSALVSRAEALQQLTSAGQQYEVSRDSKNDLHFPRQPETLRALFSLAKTSRPFLRYEDETPLSFQETYERAARLSHRLLDLGLKKGQRVFLASRNYPEYVIAFMAITGGTGAICCLANALWSADELEFAVGEIEPALFIVDSERADKMQHLASGGGRPFVVIRDRKSARSSDFIEFDSLLQGWETDFPAFVQQTRHDDAFILFTSGSTGRPKGAISTHGNVISALMSWELDALVGILTTGLKPPAPGDAGTLLAVPLFHATGLILVFLQSFRKQRLIQMMYKWNADRAYELICRENLVSLSGPAAITGDLLRLIEKRGKPESLLALGGGGAPRPAGQVLKIASTGLAPNIGWGMTETNAIGCGHGGESYATRPASSGVPSAICEMKIVNDRGEAQPDGTRGELWIAGSSIVRRYWKDRAADSWNGRFFRTGDVAVIEDGHVYIVDRIKDLIIRGGENIACARVESALASHDRVLECCVYGLPDERLGEIVGATIYCQPSPGLNSRQMRQHVEPLLARFEIPEHFRFVHEPLPRIASGKIFKRGLREEHLASMRKAKL